MGTATATAAAVCTPAIGWPDVVLRIALAYGLLVFVCWFIKFTFGDKSV